MCPVLGLVVVAMEPAVCCHGYLSYTKKKPTNLFISGLIIQCECFSNYIIDDIMDVQLSVDLLYVWNQLDVTWAVGESK